MEYKSAYRMTTCDLSEVLIDAAKHQSVLMAVLDYSEVTKDAARLLVDAICKDNTMRALGVAPPAAPNS